ncbi:MAG: hypothetical protein AAF433_17670 [Bacteroidota bacterium]
MPDSFDNWTPDPQFWDDAWTDMQGRLDADQDKRRPWLLVWPWVMTTLLAIGLVLGFYLSSPTSPELPQDAAFPILETSADATPIAQQNPTTNYRLPTTDYPTASAPDLRRPTLRSETSEDVATTYPSTQLPTTDYPTTYPAPDLRRPTLRSETSETVATTYPSTPLPTTDSPTTDPTPDLRRPTLRFETSEDVATTQLPTINTAATPDAQRSSASLPTLRGLPDDLPTQLPPTTYLLPTPLNADFGNLSPSQLITPVSKQSATSHHLRLLASQGTTAPGLGYGLGYQLNRQLGARWQLGLSLIGRHEQWPLRLGNQSLEEAVAEPITMPDPTVSLDQLENFLEQESLDFVSITTLGLELQARHILNQKWSLTAGAGLNYILLGQGPQLGGSVALGQSFNLDRSLDDNLQQSAEEILAVAGFSNFSNNAGDDREEVAVNRWQLETQAGIGYRLGRRWQLDASLRYRPTAVYDNDYLRLSRWRGQISLSYRLSQ